MASSSTSTSQHQVVNSLSHNETLKPQGGSSTHQAVGDPPAPAAHPDSLPHAPLPGDEEEDDHDNEGEESAVVTVLATPASSLEPTTMPPRSGRYAYYDSDAHRLPEGFMRIGYDADRRVYTYRDSASGQLWEGLPGNEYGRLHPLGAHDPVAERLESVWSEPLAPGDSDATVERPMTVFPDTWDPPEDHETDELPTAKWFAAKGKLGFSSLRRSILRRGGRHGHHPEADNEKFQSAERRSYEDVSRAGSVAGFSVASTLVAPGTDVAASARPRAKTVGVPPKQWR